MARPQKIFLVQFSGALLGVIGYWLYDNDAFLPLMYSLFMGFCYSLMLYFGVSVAKRLSEKTPEFSMGALMGSAMIRFVIIGVLMSLGFINFPQHALAIMLPFAMVLLSPMALLPFAKIEDD